MVLSVAPWWMFVLRGLLAILFGVLTWIVPEIALLSLVILFGAYAIADGLSSFAAAYRKDASTRADAPVATPRWALVLHGLVGVGAGLIALFLPGITALALLYVIAGFAFASGVLDIVTAVRLRKEITGEWILVVSGALSIVVGALLAAFPGPGALSVVLWVGAYAVVLGTLLVILGLKVRRVSGAAPRDETPFTSSARPVH